MGGGNSKQLVNIQSCEKKTEQVQSCEKNTEQQKVEISSEKTGVSITA